MEPHLRRCGLYCAVGGWLRSRGKSFVSSRYCTGVQVPNPVWRAVVRVRVFKKKEREREKKKGKLAKHVSACCCVFFF